MRRSWLFVGVLALALLPAQLAGAHQPALLDPAKPYVVDDPLISRALYGIIERAGDVFEIRMHLARPLATPFEIDVPHRDELRDHRPAYAIVAAGLPVPSANELARLPRPLPAGAGAVIEWNDATDRVVFFEKFLRRVYWTSEPTAYVLPAGDVTIWVWSPNRTLGKFVLGYGVEEGSFSAGDVLTHWGDFAY
jgi:hypothetical protein